MAGSVWQTEGVELSSAYCKRARKELNEDPEQIQAHLESFRRWIKSMPHLNCPTGMCNDSFIFLTPEKVEMTSYLISWKHVLLYRNRKIISKDEH